MKKITCLLCAWAMLLSMMFCGITASAEPVVRFDSETMTVTYAERDLQVPLNCTVYLAAYKNNRLVGVSAKYVGRYDTLADIAIAVSERPDKAAIMIFDATLWPIEEKREYSIADMTQRLIRDSVTVEEYFEDYYESGNIGTFEYYKTLEDARTTKVAIDLKNCTFYYNGEEVSREEMDQEYGLDYLMVEMADRITFEGPKDGYKDTVIIQDYSHRQIEAVDAENQYIKLTNGEELYLDPSYRSGNFTYNIYDETGKVLSVQDLKKNDVLSIVAPLYNGLAGDFDSVPFMDIYVSDQTVTGVVTGKIDTDTFVINGEKYDLEENANIKVGDEGVFFLTIDGKIYDSSAIAAKKNNNSAFIVAYGSDSAFGVNTHQLKLFTSEGNLETYNVAPTLKVYEETEYGYRAYIYKRNDKTQDEFFAYLADFVEDQSNKDDAVANLAKRLVTFILDSNNEISELRFAGRSIEEFGVSYYENMLYNASVPTLGGYLLDENAVVFQTPVTEIWDGCYNVDEDDVLAIKLSDANLQSEKRYSGYVYTIGDNDTAKVVLFTEKFMNKIGVWEVQDFDENTGELSYVGEDGENDSVFLNDATIIYHNGKVLSASEIEKNGGLTNILLRAEKLEYISSDGQTANIVYITGNIGADEGSEQLGFIAAYGSDASFGVNTHQLKLCTSEGNLETYDVAPTLKVFEETEYGYRAYIYKRNDKTQDIFFSDIEEIVADQSNKGNAVANLEKRMVTFRLNSDSEISELRFAGRYIEEFSVSYSENMLYNASVLTLGGYLLDENAIVFQTPVTEIWDECYNVDEDDVLAIKLSDANLQSEKRYSGYVYTIGDNDTAKVVLFTEKFMNKIGVWEVQDFDENTGELSYVGEDGENDSVFLNDATIIYHNGKVLSASEIEKNGGLTNILLRAEKLEYISSDGQTANIVYITGNIGADEGSEQLGFIAAYGSDASFGVNTHQLKLCISEGKLETYDVAPALKVYEETEYGYRAYIYKRNDKTQDVFFADIEVIVADQSNKDDAVANLAKRLVTFKLDSNNEISELRFAGECTGDFYASYRGNAMYNAQIPSLGNVLLDEKSCLFVTPVTEIAEDYYNVDEEDIYMLPFSELDDKKVGGYNMFFYQSDNQDALLAALSGEKISKSFRKEHLAVVKTKSIGIDAEGCDVDKYTFVQSGEIITKAVDYDKMSKIAVMSIGDVFLYGTNADGEICETELIYDASRRGFNSGQWRYEDYDINGAAIIYGRISEVKNGLIKLDDEMWFRLETTEKSTYAKVTEEKMAGNNPASAVSALSDVSQIVASNNATSRYAVAKIGENGTIADCVVIEWQ